MRPVARVNRDIVSGGAGIVMGTPEEGVYANGERVAVTGATVSAHHGLPSPPAEGIGDGLVEVTGTGPVFAGRRRVAVVGDRAACGHQVETGSPDVFAG